MSEVEKFAKQVELEMTEMKKIGMRVPKKAFTMIKNLEDMEDYMNMKTSECADLIIDLASIR